MDKEKNRSQAVQIKERSGRSPYFCRKAERAAPVLVGSILLYLNMERPSPFLKFSFAQSYSTLLPGLRAVKRTGAWQHPAGLSPPEDLSSCPHCLRLWLDRLLLPGRRDHCETGRHACFWLDDDRYAPFLPFIDTEAESDAGGPGASAASLLPPRQESVCRCCSSPDMTAWAVFFKVQMKSCL